MTIAPHRQAMRIWLDRYTAAVLLGVTVTGLAAGGTLHLAGAAGAGNAAWFGVSICGTAYAVWAMAASLRQRRAGVDVIALLRSLARWLSASCSPRP